MSSETRVLFEGIFATSKALPNAAVEEAPTIGLRKSYFFSVGRPKSLALVS
jgi:hypothetical protein